MPVSVSGEITGKIQTKDVQARMGENITVPIRLENNPGIMGIGLNVYYDTEKWKPKTVERGEDLDSGSLTDSIGEEDAFGRVKILWWDTQEWKEDGEILKIVFEPIGEEVILDEMRIACSVADTFREDWQEVAFEEAVCQIVVEEKAAEYAKDVAKGFTAQMKERHISKEKVRQVIENVLMQNDYSDLNEISDEKTKTKIAQEIARGMQETGMDIHFEEVSFEVISYLNEAVKEEKGSTKASEVKGSEAQMKINASIFVLSICLIILIISIVRIRKKALQKGKKEETYETKE